MSSAFLLVIMDSEKFQCFDLTEKKRGLEEKDREKRKKTNRQLSFELG